METKVLVGTTAGVCGPHQSVVHWDEIELMMPGYDFDELRATLRTSSNDEGVTMTDLVCTGCSRHWIRRDCPVHSWTKPIYLEDSFEDSQTKIKKLAKAFSRKRKFTL